MSSDGGGGSGWCRRSGVLIQCAPPTRRPAERATRQPAAGTPVEMPTPGSAAAGPLSALVFVGQHHVGRAGLVRLISEYSEHTNTDTLAEGFVRSSDAQATNTRSTKAQNVPSVDRQRLGLGDSAVPGSDVR